MGLHIGYKCKCQQNLDNTANYLVWYCKNREVRKFRPILRQTIPGEEGASRYKTVWLPDLREYRVEDPATEALPHGARLFRDQGMTSRTGSATTTFDVLFRGRNYRPTSGGWRTGESGFSRVMRADRIMPTGNTLSFKKFFDDFSAISVDNIWADVSGGVTSIRPIWHCQLVREPRQDATLGIDEGLWDVRWSWCRRSTESGWQHRKRDGSGR